MMQFRWRCTKENTVQKNQSVAGGRREGRTRRGRCKENEAWVGGGGRERLGERVGGTRINPKSEISSVDLTAHLMCMLITDEERQ